MKSIPNLSGSLPNYCSTFLDLIDSGNWERITDGSPEVPVYRRLDEGLELTTRDFEPQDCQGVGQRLTLETSYYIFEEMYGMNGGEPLGIFDSACSPESLDIDPEKNIIEDNLITDELSFACFSSPSKSFSPIFYSNLASTLLHVFLIFAATYTAYAGAPGQGGTIQKPIFVSLVDSRSNEVCRPSLASVDSVASLPSIANRSRKVTGGHDQGDPSRTEKSSEGKQVGSLEQERQSALPHRFQTTRLLDWESSKTKNSTAYDNIDFESKSMQDAAASVASAAHQEKRSAATQGDLINDFKLKLFQAIHEAAYFPKKALRSKNFGEVLVSFSVIDSGELEDLRIDKSSGSDLLDAAALQILQKASEHFPRIPEQSLHKKLTYVVPITFRK